MHLLESGWTNLTVTRSVSMCNHPAIHPPPPSCKIVDTRSHYVPLLNQTSTPRPCFFNRTKLLHIIYSFLADIVTVNKVQNAYLEGWLLVRG